MFASRFQKEASVFAKGYVSILLELSFVLHHPLTGKNVYQESVFNWDRAFVHPAPSMATNNCAKFDFGSIQRELCERQTDPNKQKHLEQRFQVCNWVHPNHSGIFKTSQDGQTFTPAMSVQTQCCAQTNIDNWYFCRYGPVESSGGYSWASLTASNIRGYIATMMPITMSFVGSFSPEGTLIGYPPLHQHHFHLEDSRVALTGGGAIITHGDDQCHSSFGGVSCLIRETPSGYATFMKPPLLITAEVNDVRLMNSSILRHFFTVALRLGDMSSRPFTQVSMKVWPQRPQFFISGHAPTFAVPLNGIWCFYREGVFRIAAEVLWSYFHTHPTFVAEMMLFAGANASELGLLSPPPLGLDIHDEALHRKSVKCVSDFRTQLFQAHGAFMVCHYHRLTAMQETLLNTCEVDGRFYRNTLGCRPFSVSRGLPVVALLFLAPSSRAVVQSSDGIAHVHTFFRFFVSTSFRLPVIDPDANDNFFRWRNPCPGCEYGSA